MSNICDTQYKVRGTRKALTDLWNTLQELNVNTTNVYLYKLAEHYGIDYEHRGISVRGHIYWAEFEDDEDGGLLSFDTESAVRVRLVFTAKGVRQHLRPLHKTEKII